MSKRRKHKDRAEAGRGAAPALRGGAASDSDAPPPLPKPTAVGTGLGALLERAGLSELPKAKDKPTRGAKGVAGQKGAAARGVAGKPAAAAPAPQRAAAEKPRAPYSTAELSALNQAYRGVAPIRRAKRVSGERVAKPRPVVPPLPDPADEQARERLGALVGGAVRFDVHWDDGLVQALRAGGGLEQLARVQSARFEPDAQIDLHGKRRAEAQRALSAFVRAAHARGARRLLVIVGKGEHSDDGVGVLGPAAVEVLTAGVAAPLVAAVASAHASLGGRGALAVLLR